MRTKTFILAIILVCGQVALVAQNIQVDKQNKTIAITADESVSVDAEVAILHIGCDNYGPTKDAAFQENARIANAITKAMLDAKIPKAAIETELLRLEHVDPNESWTPEMKNQRHFEAQQTWKVTVKASDAQSVVSLAMQNGANNISGADWDVADPLALQAKASGAALVKARAIADQMAKGLGAKLGDLIYASNAAPVARPRFMPGIGEGYGGGAGGGRYHDKSFSMTLFPQKVTQGATVYAVFAIE